MGMYLGMKQRKTVIFCAAQAALFAAAVVLACESGVLDADSGGAGAPQPLPSGADAEFPVFSEAAVFFEDFESGGFTQNGWTLNTAGGNISVETNQTDAAITGSMGNKTKYAKLAPPMGGSVSLSREGIIVPEGSYAISFAFKTDLAEYESLIQNIKVYVDGIVRLTAQGLSSGWKVESLPVSAGAHSIRFEAASGGGYFPGNANAAYVDCISVVPDKCSTIVIAPYGEQTTYINAPDEEKIRLKAEGRRADGTAVSVGASFAFTTEGVDANGTFTPAAAGVITITASVDGAPLAEPVKTIRVHPENYLRLPFFYQATGTTYSGYTAGGSGSIASSDTVTISYPPVSTFEADAFFTIEGVVSNSAASNYALLQVKGPGNTSVNYYLKDAFKKRIWLRNGPGEYQILMWDLTSLQITSGGEILGYGGSIKSIMQVTNTRSEPSADGTHGMYIYPSNEVQSDSFLVSNLVNHICNGAADKREKALRINNYLCQNIAYDDASTANGARKKQDALTVLFTRYHTYSGYTAGHLFAVCEGYSNAAAALLRQAGIETRYISGAAMKHAWNHVYIDGAWKFLDVTWNDPVVDPHSPDFVRYTYFLLDTLYPALVGGENRTDGIPNNRSLL